MNKFTIWFKTGRDAPWKWYMSSSFKTVAVREFGAIIEQYPQADYPDHRAVLCQGEYSDRRLPYLMEDEDILETYPPDLDLPF